MHSLQFSPKMTNPASPSPMSHLHYLHSLTQCSNSPQLTRKFSGNASSPLGRDSFPKETGNMTHFHYNCGDDILYACWGHTLGALLQEEGTAKMNSTFSLLVTGATTEPFHPQSVLVALQKPRRLPSREGQRS